MMMNYLPFIIDLAPHVGEARLNWLTVVLWTSHECIHTSVQVCVLAESLDIVCSYLSFR